ncbi:MAG: GNAT family N-acetyltransferase [Candidatus Woesearchaeota archaeon]|jgi:hypothetical protein|nr:hypothetical protein [archaeon]MDP6547970.1 GNAT family N-acetyltransferase [Candidatus Woesearchaeota archaeon]MDP7263624.1 GNAT family N-acetyltransferase [Candidatus Woesearchaeota archaeon]MDP7622609.1 GNAT family N-acetyltransferase [Candidatus Woesearchaeota archaeon]HJN57357.1 GNAT family N-acetyltransferase [Candidatus Woesearchaeota archaeon]|tara:strand:- start:45597 stop:46478 length:882 start_codon:yes stop_codon:yes gene_type:complete
MLKFKTITDEKECKSLWNIHTKKKVIWDLWDFRSCFHNKDFKFNFILGLNDKNQVGLLPLVYHKKEDIYTYFGDTFPEQNKFLIKEKKLLPDFLKQCPEDTTIYYIDKSEKKFYDFEHGEKRYFLNLSRYEKDIENYLKTFSKKHRKNLKYDIKKLIENGFKAVINKKEDFDKLVSFNKKKFGKESDYSDPNFVKSMKKLLEAAEKMQLLHIISLDLNGAAEAVGLGLTFNKVYYVIGSGRNPEIKNSGKLLIFEQIKHALNLNCNEIDFLSAEAGWKELWNLESEQMYEFYK